MIEMIYFTFIIFTLNEKIKKKCQKILMLYKSEEYFKFFI